MPWSDCYSGTRIRPLIVTWWPQSELRAGIPGNEAIMTVQSLGLTRGQMERSDA